MFALGTCEICGCAVVVKTGKMDFTDPGMEPDWTETGAMERHLQWHWDQDKQERA